MALMDRDTRRGGMRSAVLALLAVGSFVAGQALAGQRSDVMPTVLYPTSQANGSMGQARAAKNANNTDDGEMVRVEIVAYSDNTSEAKVTFADASGAQKMCHSNIKSVVDALAAAIDSKVAVAFSGNGTNNPECTQVVVTN